MCALPFLSRLSKIFQQDVSSIYVACIGWIMEKYLHNSCSIMSYQLYMYLCNKPQIPPSNKLLNMYSQDRFNVSADQIMLQKVCQMILACSFWQQPSFLERIKKPKTLNTEKLFINRSFLCFFKPSNGTLADWVFCEMV